MALSTRQIVHVASVFGLALACSSSNDSPSPSTGGASSGGSPTAGNTSGGLSNNAGSPGAGTAGATAGATSGGVANGGTAGSGTAGQATAGASGGGTAGAGGASGGAAGTAGTATGGAGAGAGGAGAGGGGAGGAGAGGGGSAGMSGGGSGGTAGSSGTCSRAVGSCTAPTVTVTDVSLGIAVTGYGSQADTDPLPMAISAIPGGGSRLAWLGTDKKVYIAELDCDDKLVGTPFSVPAEDLQDIYADANGGVVMVTRNATNSGTDNCGSGVLCGGTSVQCQGTWLVRFDKSGNVTWQTQVTNLSDTRAGYDDDSIFTWQRYQHHGRIAFDGTNYAAYFAAAISVYRTGNSGCVDVHEGDRMQVVDGSGKVVTGHNSFPWGCSHSWTTRMLWDSTNSAFVMTCATDADNCAIERPGTGNVLFQATCSGQFFNGDLINSSAGGYWSAWSDTNAIRLNQFSFNNTKGASVSNAGASQHPHLVAYSSGKMLLSWGSGSTQKAQVRSMTDGAAIGSELTINVKDHAFQAYKPYADGSVAFPAAGSNSTSVKIARVLPCQ